MIDTYYPDFEILIDIEKNQCLSIFTTPSSLHRQSNGYIDTNY